MSNWLNFNESLSSLKGQLSNFANNVLADTEEGADVPNESFEELRTGAQDLEIQHLKRINAELLSKISGSQNGENNWEWTPMEEASTKEALPDLKTTIRELENEKNDLMAQLEQLDTENQQNLAQLVAIRGKLVEENEELKEKFEQLKQQYKTTVAREKKLQKQLQGIQTNTKSAENDVPSTNERDKNELITELDEAKKELSVLKSTHNTLEQFKIKSEKELQDLHQHLKQIQDENNVLSNELQQSKQNLKISEIKSQEDEENCKKLAFILESYEKQVTRLKEELEAIKNENKNIQKSREEALEKLDQKDKGLFQTTEKRDDSQQYEIEHLKENLAKLNDDYKVLQSKKDDMHRSYIRIITDNVKRYMDSGSVHSENADDPQALEFNKHVENIFKILLDFKEKCQSLECQILEASQEKTHILNEKNEDIEKLMQNSEVLSQEVINKAKIVAELESEISNLITNNDVLMSEIESYKNSSSLQTISETNEDSMVLLETALDNANEKIKELEKIVEHDKSDSDQVETSPKKDDYSHLLNDFDILKIDYESVTKELAQTKDQLFESQTETENIKCQLEKARADLENLDYQLSEANFTIDNMREEMETMENKFDALVKDSAQFKIQAMANVDLKSELNEIKERYLSEENLRRSMEAQVKNLTEKLQNSKMTETSFKLQCDTLSKENLSLNETKVNLEGSLTSIKSSLTEYEKNYTDLLQKYDDILLKCEDLNTQLHQKESLRLKLDNQLTELEEQKNELSKLLKSTEASDLIQKMEEQLKTKDGEITSLLSTSDKYKKQLEELENAAIRERENWQNLKNVNDEEIKSFKEQLKNKYEDISNHKKYLADLERTVLEEQENCKNIKRKNDEEIETFKKQLQTKDEEIMKLLNESIAYKQQLAELEKTVLQEKENYQNTKNNDQEMVKVHEHEELQKQIVELQASLLQSQNALAPLQMQLQELATSRNELINMITIKHQENVAYHQEIQRLSDIIKTETDKSLRLEAQLLQASTASESIAKKNEAIDKLTDEINFLKEKCDILTKNLLEEQSSNSGPTDKEISLSKQIDRLQSHMMEVEEHYTQELVQAEQKNTELQAKLTDLEQRERNSSNMYTSVSIRANQQVEALQKQLQTVTSQREELRKKISDAEDANSKQAVALSNLQFVLEQFQKERENDVIKETARIRRQINAEKQVQEELKKDIESLKEQLEESKQGLQAAARLSDQLELVKKQNTGLKDEVSQLQQKLLKSEQTVNNLTSQTDGKIEKGLIKNLVVGFLSSGNTNWNKDQAQVLKIIATVLDFNQQDHDKVKLNKAQQGSWLGSILSPQYSAQNMSQESLSQAFVKFLENESRPRIVPNLLDSEATMAATNGESSKSSTPSATPIVLNEIVLPTFMDFGQIRNSSSILKDVLKDNNNL